MAFERLSPADWDGVQLVYVCSPGNPTGRVMTLDEWRQLFELSDRHGFVIAADECYSEIYFDESRPPLGALQAALALGSDRFERLSCSPACPSVRTCRACVSGYVAGDAEVIRQFLLYRTYHGNAMSPPVQSASIAAWKRRGPRGREPAPLRAEVRAGARR